MKIQPKGKRVLLRVALGEVKSDLAIENVQLVNVTIGEIHPASVYAYDGFISYVEYKELGRKGQFVKEAVDRQGKYPIPGLIGAHEHIESSTMTSRNLAKAAAPEGTTTVIINPHEIGNVWGTEGVRYMYEVLEGLPMRQLIDMPSCVSAVPGLGHAGAEFGPAQIEELAKLEWVVGLVEVMDYLDVIHGGDRMMDIIRTAEKHGLYFQDHAPFMEGRMLSAYLYSGPNTCHESRAAEEALERMRGGMRVDVRDSSITKNVEAIWSGVKDFRFFDNFCLCTDDRGADDILHNGHINDVVRAAIRYGMEPVAAIKGATLNPAREAGLQNLGAVIPGYVADTFLVDDLRGLTPSRVSYAGKLVVREGRLLAEIEDKPYPLELTNPVHVRELATEGFTIHPPVSQGKVKVSLVKYYDMNLSTTDTACEEVWIKDGRIDISGDQDLKSVTMVNRYEDNDNIALGLVRGFGTKVGTLASMVSHDSHNLTIMYNNPEEVLMAVEELVRTSGGMCAAEERKILHTSALPLAGLVPLKFAGEPAEGSAVVKDANRAPGLTNMEDPLLRIVTLALPVTPDAKMSDMGLVQVIVKRIVPLFPE